MNEIFDDLSDKSGKLKYYMINETLSILIKNVVDNLRNNRSIDELVESIGNMFDNIECFLSLEEKEDQAEIINELGSCLSLHGWQFPGFIVTPNSKLLLVDLLNIVEPNQIRSPYYYDNIA